MSNFMQRIMEIWRGTGVKPPPIDVDIPPELAWVSKPAYKQGYNDGDGMGADNPFEIGTLQHESWKLGHKLRGSHEMNIW